MSNSGAREASSKPIGLPMYTAEEFRTDLLTPFSAEALGAKYSNSVIDGDLNLKNLDVPTPIELDDVEFRGIVNAADAKFLKSVRLRNCYFAKYVEFHSARFEGSL